MQILPFLWQQQCVHFAYVKMLSMCKLLLLPTILPITVFSYGIMTYRWKYSYHLSSFIGCHIEILLIVYFNLILVLICNLAIFIRLYLFWYWAHMNALLLYRTVHFVLLIIFYLVAFYLPARLIYNFIILNYFINMPLGN